jgi:two-component system, OmpR family, sensor kinase
VTIRRRLTLWYGAAIAATLVAFGLIVWFQYAAALRSSLDETLEVQASDVRAALRAGDEASIARQDPAEPGIFTAVFDMTGRIARQSSGVPVGLRPPARTSAPESLTTQTVSLRGQTYSLVALTAPAGRTIVTGSSLAAVDRSLGSLARLEVVVALFGSLLSLAGGWWLAGRALRPVDVLTREADTIGLDDLDRRLPEPSQLDELGRLARTLNAMLERVRSAVRREHALLAAVSHDLRTPIAALRAELELADDPSIDREALLTSVRAAHGDTVRLGELANDLLSLAEAEAGGRELVRETIDVDALVDGPVRRLEPLAAERSITVEPHATPTPVIVDRIRLEQALSNLLSNALRIVPAGSRVEIVAGVVEHSPRTLEVDVLDRGPGVPAAAQPRLFVPFGAREIDEAGRGGTGLGLATAAAAVHAHGGEIGYRDRPGGGAIFWFRVPA